MNRTADLQVASSLGRAVAQSAARLRRVLYAVNLDPGAQFGSLEEQMFLQARSFQAHGGLFLPLFLAPPGPGKLTRYEEVGLPAECLDLSRFRIGQLRKLVALLHHNRIDVVNWNFTQPVLNPYLWALTLLTPRIKHYFTDRSSRTLPLPPPAGGLKAMLKRILLRRYSRVLCVSQFVHDCLTHQRAWSNLVTCTHFVNTKRFRPDPAARAAFRKEKGVEQAFVIVTVAYLIRAKGIDVLCRALATLPAQAILWVVGDGPETAALRQLTQELGVAGRVHFLGKQAHVQAFMQAADCFVCPSLWAEAAGWVNLEAQATGLPLIASRIGGIPEYVEDGYSGMLFLPGDAVALGDCLRRLVADPELSRRLGRQARERMIERFSAESRLEAHLNLYRW